MAVKRTRQKGGTVVTIEEFLSLERPKGDLLLKVGREQVSVNEFGPHLLARRKAYEV